ncbi:hypothetical protein DVK85_07155 [Flavobacterium arcticum]|uniref:Lipoprotein n=1 Tax=Flavobacterium arcticum TaxID=1784713 RepID=A0A345HBS4_9FLAO|nr:hypothetical protein [Flavobacterium arcticum]AXG74034.1 hypothetical protein DVK85_07155 [Flavobacterium arcticum]KAF2509011.1 hypothetical protein E0W72_10640 [Flavobacterium arcticum]
MRKYFILLVSFSLLGCLSKKEEEEGFVCEQENRVVKLEFENGQEYLKLNQPTELRTSFKNIKRAESSIYGIGIRMLGKKCGDNCFLCSVTVNEKSVVDGKYEIIVNYRVDDDKELKKCKFLIPVEE